MLTRTQLKGLFARYGFRPLKRFGENYLIDANIKDKMIAEAALKKEDVVLEIGPGLGALTFDIAASGARTIAVEKDKKAFSILEEMAHDASADLELVCDDILKFDLDGITTKGKFKVIGNLPYYITTPIIAFIIDNRERIAFALLTVQREVANRILAAPGTKDYGALSCFVQYYTAGAYLHTIRRTSFYPEPEVDSSLIRLDMLARPSVDVKNEDMFFKIVRCSFNQRRKSIINSLSRKEALDMTKEKLSAILNGVNIDPSRRPETLSLSDFAAIADSIS